jgi:hypothetical protein
MYYTLEDDLDSSRKLKVNHEKNENALTLSVSYGEEFDFDNYKHCQIDLDKEQLHEFIGMLLHIQQKMKGGK